MNTQQIDLLNTGLILMSFFLAYWLPFELFLFAYAVLGPLHYFTEINWIRDQKYFVANTFWIYWVIVAALLISIPPLVRVFSVAPYHASSVALFITNTLPPYLNACLFLAIVGAVGFTVFKEKKHQYLTLLAGIILAIVFHFLPMYHLIVGIFLPTIIHVYLFTILFMWYGILKNNSQKLQNKPSKYSEKTTKNSSPQALEHFKSRLSSKIGYLNILLMLLVPVAILLLSVEPFNYILGFDTRAIYEDNTFYVLNAKISQAIGLSDGSIFSFEAVMFIKIQIFIAFAYTYHYLNWFSKTTVIGWHKKLTQKRSFIILLMWIASVALYFYNYKIGFTLLLFLSFVHVFMEFPLNILSIKGIGRSIFNSTKN